VEAWRVALDDLDTVARTVAPQAGGLHDIIAIRKR
jgi:hypothetical protein